MITTTLISAAISCTKEDPYPHAEGNAISIFANTPKGYETKAMFETDEYFNKKGNRIQIFDILQNGSIHINDQIEPEVEGNKYGHNNVWPFVNGRHQWTPDVHRFFGWLLYDANIGIGLNDVFTGTTLYKYDEATKKLTLTLAPPTKGLNYDSEQFDFLYSGIELRDQTTTPDYATPVNLEMYHLFTAFGIGAKNNTSKDIIIKNFEVVELRNSANVTIEYTTNSFNVNYNAYNVTSTQKSHDNKLLYKKIEEVLTLESGASTANLYKGTINTEREYKLIYPQFNNEECPMGDMYIKYSYEGMDGEYEARVKFPANLKWLAGKKYHFDIIFDKEPGSVWVNYIVADWDDVSWNLEFEAPLHTMLLTEPNNEADAPTNVPTIYYDNSTTLGESGAFIGYFKMDSPAGISWKPTLTNASAADYEVRLYTNKKEDGSIQDNYNIPVTTANIEAEIDRFYKIVVVPKNPDNVNKVVKLGITYAPLWNEEANPLLIINKSGDGYYYPWPDDETNPDNYPDECWISIKQVANTTF